MEAEPQKTPDGALQRLRRLKGLAPKIARLSAFVTVLWVLCIGVMVWQARADMNESLMDFGVQMMQYAGAERQDAPRTLLLNGQEMRFSTAHTTHGVDAVLDFYEGKCAEHSTRMHEQFAELAQRRGGSIPEGSTSSLDGIMRHEDGDRGFVACLDTGGERIELAELTRRLEAFQESGDLSAIGHLRYAYANRPPGRERTHLVAFWTEGPLNIREMFPTQGDAPGADLRDVPRPAGSRRILHAWEEGHPESMLVYGECSRRKEGLLRSYRQVLPEHGWTVFANAAMQREQPDGSRFLVAEKNERMITLVFTEDDEGRGVTTVLTSR
jgi:hypothetical protein